VNEKWGYVYLAEAGGYHKIGISITPPDRIKHFDTIMPIDVELVCYFEADNAAWAENILHRYFEKYRHKGEWFKFGEYAYYWIEILNRIRAFRNGHFEFVGGRRSKRLVVDCKKAEKPPF